MFNKLKHTFKQTAIYSLGNISTKLIGLVLLPLYTDRLTTTEYGVWAILEVTSQIMIGILAVNLPLAMLRWSSAEKDQKKLGGIVFTTIISLLIIIALSLTFLLPSTEYFSRLLFNSTKFSTYLFYLFLVVGIGIYNGVPLNIIRIKEKSVFYVIVTSIKFTIILLLNIYFIVYQNEGVGGIVKSQLIGELFLFLFTIPLVLKSVSFHFELKTFIEMIKYGAPLIFSTTSSFILSFGDRYILQYYLTEASVGIYSLGYKIASILNMLLLQSFQLGFLPIAYKKLGEPDDKRFFSKILTYYTLLLTFAGLSIALYSREIIELFAKNHDYWSAASVVPIIALAFVLKGIQYNFALSFHYAKKTIYNAAIVVTTAIINLGMNFYLIQKFELYGAAYSMLISMIFMLIISFYFGKRIFPIPFELMKLIKIITVGILLFYFSSLFGNFELLTRIIYKSAIVISFPFIIYLFGVFDTVEKETVKNYLKSLFNSFSNRAK